MLKKILLIFAGVIVALGVYAFAIEPDMIELVRLDITDAQTEMRIGLIADFQRRNMDPAFVQRVADMLDGEDLDLVLIAGDFIDKSPDELPSVAPLKKLETKHGVYGVLGNHDYDVYFLDRNNADMELGETVIEYMEDKDSVKILRNENIVIGNVTVIGLDSYWAGLRDVRATFADAPDGFRIVLAHNQDHLEIDGSVADLYLFGHTHCGQVRLPFLGSVPKVLGFMGEYDYRHYTVNGADVYTTCGLAPAPRFLNPPEVTIIGLQ